MAEPKVKTNNLNRFRARMLDEAIAMAEHAFSSGMTVSGDIAKDLEGFLKQGGENDVKDEKLSMDRLAHIHNSLSELVHPAKPRGLLYVKQQRAKPFFSFFGPIPAIRHMVILSLAALGWFVYFSVSGHIDGESLQTSFLERDNGNRIEIAFFLLSAAGVGASFASLYSAYEYVSKGVFDPSYTQTYWVRFFLGLTAGYILAELVFIPDNAKEIFSETPLFTKPLIALLGGFSANTVHRILDRVTEALGTLVESSARTKVENLEAALQNKMAKKNMDYKIQLTQKITEAKSQLQQNNQLSGDVQKQLDSLIKEVMHN